jgi:hypothetical protein
MLKGTCLQRDEKPFISYGVDTRARVEITACRTHAYLAGFPIVSIATIMGIHGTMASVACIPMQATLH